MLYILYVTIAESALFYFLFLVQYNNILSWTKGGRQTTESDSSTILLQLTKIL
jgi:hypothetical protein